MFLIREELIPLIVLEVGLGSSWNVPRPYLAFSHSLLHLLGFVRRLYLMTLRPVNHNPVLPRNTHRWICFNLE